MILNFKWIILKILNSYLFCILPWLRIRWQMAYYCTCFKYSLVKRLPKHDPSVCNIIRREALDTSKGLVCLKFLSWSVLLHAHWQQQQLEVFFFSGWSLTTFSMFWDFSARLGSCCNNHYVSHHNLANLMSNTLIRNGSLWVLIFLQLH